MIVWVHERQGLRSANVRNEFREVTIDVKGSMAEDRPWHTNIMETRAVFWRAEMFE